MPPVIFRRLRVVVILAGLASLFAVAYAQQDPLPSWNDGPAKQAIVQFVRVTTDPASPKYVKPEERIATFDEDGTTWVEHPMYTEVVFSLDRVVELAPKHPEWKDKQPFKAVITGDHEAMKNFTLDQLKEIIVATHTGVTTDEFDQAAKQWIAHAKHPRWNRPYTDLAYQPMLEVIKYLRANGYKTYIVTGGTQPFVRSFAEKVYGISPEQIIGTATKSKFDPHKKNASFGNTRGDFDMLAYAQGAGASIEMLILHDDAKREYAYGPAQGLPDSKVGTFPQSLYDEAKKRNWIVVSMKNDWNRIFAWE